MPVDFIDHAILSDKSTIVVRGGGYVRQYGDQSYSQGGPRARLYANRTHVGLQIHSHIYSWITNMTVEEPGRDAQGFFSIMLAWRDVATVQLAPRHVVVSSRSHSAFGFGTHRTRRLKPFVRLLNSLDIPVVPVRRTWPDLQKSTRYRFGREFLRPSSNGISSTPRHR